MRHRFVLVPADLETTLLMVILPATLFTTSGCHRREYEGTRNVSSKQIVANVLAPKRPMASSLQTNGNGLFDWDFAGTVHEIFFALQLMVDPGLTPSRWDRSPRCTTMSKEHIVATRRLVITGSIV
jgi:hypothetical protein